MYYPVYVYTHTNHPATHSPSPSITIQRGTTTGSPYSASTAFSLLSAAAPSFLFVLVLAAAGSYLCFLVGCMLYNIICTEGEEEP